MSKKMDELLPSDKVMIEFGPKTQRNGESGEIDTIEAAKTLDLPFGFFLNVTQDSQGQPLEEYNGKTGYSKTIGRTVKVVGMAGYEDQTTDRGETISVPVVGKFATDASRAELKAAAEKAEKEATKAYADEKKKAEVADKAKADFEANQAKEAEAEQEKRKLAEIASQAAANKPA